MEERSSVTFYIAVGIILFLLLAIGAVTWWLWRAEEDSFKAKNQDQVSATEQQNETQNDVDSDGDRLNDAAETDTYQTNPLLSDTDGDGFDDKTEIDNGFDPLVDQSKTGTETETDETNNTATETPTDTKNNDPTPTTPTDTKTDDTLDQNNISPDQKNAPDIQPDESMFEDQPLINN